MLRPSGEKDTLRSCSGVSVMRRVVAKSVEVTKTSPRATKTISLPSGATSNSVTPRLRLSMVTGGR